MLWIILFAIVGIVIGIIVTIDLGDGFLAGLGWTTVIGLVGCLIGLVVLLISSAIADCSAEKTYYTVEDTEIYALQDNVGVEGSFYLGSGHIDDNLKYFYVKQTDLGYTVCDVNADDAYIQYTSDKCHLVRRSYKFNNRFVRLIAMPMENDKYIFYIPDGSIINNYAIDLK